MTDLRKAGEQALESLRGYRREMSCHQPCDAEVALEAALKQPEHPRRLTDDQIGQIWFAAKIPGLTESDARRLIRAAEDAK